MVTGIPVLLQKVIGKNHCLVLNKICRYLFDKH